MIKLNKKIGKNKIECLSLLVSRTLFWTLFIDCSYSWFSCQYQGDTPLCDIVKFNSLSLSLSLSLNCTLSFLERKTHWVFAYIYKFCSFQFWIRTFDSLLEKRERDSQWIWLWIFAILNKTAVLMPIALNLKILSIEFEKPLLLVGKRCQPYI